VIIFVFIQFLYKKKIKLKFFLKKSKTGLNRPVLGSVRFFRRKTGSNRFGSVFFCFFYLGSVRFFQFQAYKTKPIGFLKILIGLIKKNLRFSFFSYFFLIFSI